MYRSTSEPSSGDRSTGVECSQPSIMDTPDEMQAFLQSGDQLSTETQVEASLTEAFSLGQQSEIEGDTISLSSALIPSVINDGVQELPAAVDLFIQTPIVSEVPSDRITTEAARLDDLYVSEVTFSTQTTTTTSQISYGRSQIKKRKKVPKSHNWIEEYIPIVEKKNEDDDDLKKLIKPIEDDFFIPEGLTDFCFGEHTVSVGVRDLYGVPLIGNGAFGSVYYARIPEPVIIDVAVKRVLRSAKAEVRTLELVATGDHPNIVAYYCALSNPGTDEMCICMEYMDTSLFTFYRAMHQLNPIPYGPVDYLLRRILRDCVQGLFHLQIKGLAHRDIKPHNILLNWDGVVKLCDFGISISLAELKLKDTPEKGTEHYIPPNRACDIQDDMWSLGLSLLEITNGRNPFIPDENGFAHSKLGWTPDVPTTISPQMRICILRLLRINPKDRPCSYEDILNWSCVNDVSEIPSMGEKDFVRYVIGQIPQHRHPDW